MTDVQLLAYLMDFNAKHKESARNKHIKKNIFGILWSGTSYLQDKSIFNKKSKKDKSKSKSKNENKENESSSKLIESWHAIEPELSSERKEDAKPHNLEENIYDINDKKSQDEEHQSNISLRETGHIMISYNKGII